MQYIEIVLLGLVAAFLVLRLRAVLGRRTGNEMPPDLSPRMLGWLAALKGKI